MSEKFEEIKIPVPWGHVSAKWWGAQNRQPIIAIHGWYDNAGSFDTLAPLIVKHGLPVLCIDLPGHGLSSWYPPGMQYTTWSYVVMLRRIVLHYGWQKITLIGHSLGGSITFIYASSFPNDVKKYINFDIAAPITKNPIEELNKLGLRIDNCLKTEGETSGPTVWQKYETIINFLDQIYQGSLTRKSIEILLKRATKVSGDKYQVNVDERVKYINFSPLSLEHVYAMADKIICDVMYVRGKQGIVFYKAEYYYGVIEKVKRSKVKKTYVVDGSHHLHLNNPESVINEVVDFLQLSN